MSKSYTQKTKLHISRTFNAWELSWRINSTATGKKKMEKPHCPIINCTRNFKTSNCTPLFFVFLSFSKHPNRQKQPTYTHRALVVFTYTETFTLGRVPKQDVPHVLELDVTWDPKHGRRKVLLERAEQQRTKLQLQVLIVVGLVILVRIQPQPVRCVLSQTRRNDTVPVSGARSRRRLLSSVQRTIYRHGSPVRERENRISRYRNCLSGELSELGFRELRKKKCRRSLSCRLGFEFVVVRIAEDVELDPNDVVRWVLLRVGHSLTWTLWIWFLERFFFSDVDSRRLILFYGGFFLTIVKSIDNYVDSLNASTRKTLLQIFVQKKDNA